ncbi:MAG TPA: DUF2461 domain-containing protein, partial [Thermohalobaculum sp.]|nr:DUF2461 domain-containing protein [Thermohalobaculum sp.]
MLWIVIKAGVVGWAQHLAIVQGLSAIFCGRRARCATEGKIMAKTPTNPSPGPWGFPVETVAFLRDLKANNDREWFARHKSVHESAVQGPAKAFCAQVTDALHGLTGMAHGWKIFRIHRDVRFSKDKTPYNAHLHVSFIPAQSRGLAPVWHFGLDPDEMALGVGAFGFDKPGLERYRARVVGSDGDDLRALLGGLVRGGMRLSEPE